MDLKKLSRINIPLQVLKGLENKQESTKLVNNLFWGFNSLLVLILVLNEIFGFFFVPVIQQLIQEYSFTTLSLYSILLYVVPIFTLFIRTKLRGNPAFKLKYLFGIEIPILITIIIRQEMLWELNMSLKYLFLVLFAMIVIYSIQIFSQHNEANGKLRFILKLRKLVLYSFNVFFSIIFIGSIIPLSLILLKNSLNLSLVDDVYFIGYLGINIILIALIILVLRPTWFALKYSTKHFKNMVSGMNLKSRITYFISIIILFSALYMLNINNREFMYLNLKNEPSLLKQKELFFNNMDQIEEELHRSASLRKYYLGSLQNNVFSWIMEDQLNLNDKQTKLLQSSYNVFMYPFFCQDKRMNDYALEYEARTSYEQLFDKPMHESNYFNDFGFSWTNVHIDKQEIDIKEYGDIAEIQICETYSTNSDFQEEIVIHFELPYNSVVTGLWISDDKFSDKKYPGIVAPSGAAQKVYINEVLKRVDPALLSHIGSNKYSLRAFPIMNKKTISQDTLLDDRYKNNYQFRVWYTYKTFISKNNNWVLPKLLYKWNVKWSDKTKTFINGDIYQRSNSWLPNYIAARKAVKLKEHTANIAGSIQINSKPIESTRYFNFNENIAILIDGSYSMNKNRERLIDNLNEIKSLFSNFNKLDCFIVGNDINELEPEHLLDELDANPQLFFGKTHYMAMLDNFTSKINDYANKYKSIVLFSDITNYRYPENGLVWSYDEYESYDTLRPRKLDCPFIIFNLSKKYHQLNPNDFFNQIVYKSKGGFAKNKNELINLLKYNDQHANNLVVFQGDIAYYKSKVFAPSDTLFKDFAIKEFINHYRLGDTVKLVDLDELNEMARQENIVTKYSSMIALVNQVQVDSLKSAQTHHDRYNNFRESESRGSGVLGLLDTFGTPIPKYPETVVVFMFLFLFCIMIFADRLR